MPALAAQILAALFPSNPFEGFDHLAYPRDLQGGIPSALMREAFDAAQPRLIIEVGTWKGATACYWASLLRQRGMDGVVICVDTWLGGLEHFRKGTLHSKQWEMGPYRKHGYPTLYYQFLANVVHEGLQDFIVPFPNTSAIAARWLASRDTHADLIFIDASHDEEDVYADLRAYWKLLQGGGVMCGDDWHPGWQGVVNSVKRFAQENGIEIVFNGNTWALQKPQEQ